MIYIISEGDGSNYCVRSVYEGPDGIDKAELKRRFDHKSLPPGTDTWLAFADFLTEVGLVEVDFDEIWMPY